VGDRVFTSRAVVLFRSALETAELPDQFYPSLLELERMNVHSLRRYARALPEFPIAGRAISNALRAELIQLLKSHLERLDTNLRRVQVDLPRYSDLQG
jgi:hypothetical protein